MSSISLHQIATKKVCCQRVDAIDPAVLSNQSQTLEPKHTMTCQLPLSYSVHRDGHQFFLGKSVDQFNCNYTFQARDLVALPRARLIDSSWAIVSYDNYLFSDSYFNKQLLQKSGSFLENNLKLNIDGQLQEIPFALYKNDLARNVVNTACYLPL